MLGCDSVFELEGVAYRKPQHRRGRPRTLEAAKRIPLECWIRAIGSFVSSPPEPGPRPGRFPSTVVDFSTVSDAEIEAYVASGEPLPCAGAFTIRSAGCRLHRVH